MYSLISESLLQSEFKALEILVPFISVEDTVVI